MTRRHSSQPTIVHSHFNTGSAGAQRPLLAWRRRVGHVMDVVHSVEQVEKPFDAAIDRYEAGNLVFTDCRSDPLMLERSITRISTDRVRSFAFHLFLAGGVDFVRGGRPSHSRTPAVETIVALDMNQPVRMQRHACRMLTVFVPRPLMESVFPSADAVHGRIIENTTPVTQNLVHGMVALNRELPGMSVGEAEQALSGCVHLLSAAFSKQARLSGDARAAARAMMFGRVRRYIQAHIHDAGLSPDVVLKALGFPRPTLYRLFEHEGGLGAYIRHLRVREAADELVNYPQVAIIDIAYGLGFKSASDFSRAFRRAYDMAPQDLRTAATKKGEEADRPVRSARCVPESVSARRG